MGWGGGSRDLSVLAWCQKEKDLSFLGQISYAACLPRGALAKGEAVEGRQQRSLREGMEE